MKTMIERGKAARKSPLINFNMVELVFRMMKIPGVARRHIWSRGDLNNMRFLPVNEDIEAPEGSPLPIELLYRLIDEASYRVVIDYCFCRRGCDCKTYPISTGCIVLGEGAKQIAPSVRREVGVEEARRHVDDAVATGLVPFIGKIRLDNLLYGIRDHGRFLTVCFCCECCCVSRFTSGIVGLNGAPGNGPKPVIRMRSFWLMSPQHISDLFRRQRRRDAAVGDLGFDLLHFGADRGIGA